MTNNPSGGTPVPIGAYDGLVFDAPGTVAQNVFLALFNPATSGRVVNLLDLETGAYTIGASSTASSLLVSRITGFTGGSVATPASVPRFITTMPDPKCQVITGNPTVTFTGTPVNATVPPLSTGAATAGSTILNAEASALVLPGQGIAVYTLAGNLNQVWNIKIPWEEF